MKIAFVFSGLGFGGVERVGVDYVKLCLQLGHEVDVYNLVPDHNANVKELPQDVHYYEKKFSRLICPEIYSYGVQKWWWGKYAYPIISPAVTLAQGVKKLFTKRRKYDIAIAFAGHINDLSYVAKGFVKAKKRISWCHGNLMTFLATCDGFPMLYKKVDTIVTLSSAAERHIYLGRHFLYDKTITKIYNPTFIAEKKTDASHVEELKRRFGDFILMTARVTDGKGHLDAIRTAKALRARGQEKHIVFVGDGPMMKECLDFAAAEGVADLCHFEGARYDVCDYVEASHIDLLTSYHEGLPTVIVEAMTLGKPCVMTNCDDGEVSDHGKYCKLVPVGNVEAVADALCELYASPEEYETYCRLSRERAKVFTPSTVKEQLKGILHV